MLRCFGLAVMCGCCWLAGCQAAKLGHSSSSAKSSPVVQEKPVSSIELFHAFVERPLGDPFLNCGFSEVTTERSSPTQIRQECLWSSTDRQVVDFERQPLLEENGFRVGRIVGMIPTRLMTLLKSEHDCKNARYRVVPCGERAVLQLGPILPRSSFLFKNAGQCQPMTIDQARYCLEVVAILCDDDFIKLEFVPRVEHGPSAFAVGLTADLSGYVKKAGPAHQSFPSLSWHVLVKPGETLVIGANLEEPDSLGCRSFTQDDGTHRIQRVLILRTNRLVEVR